MAIYTPADLEGRSIVVVANLEPATIRGIESRGMLLAAKAGATYISPFVGRVDDIAWGGDELVEHRPGDIHRRDPADLLGHLRGDEAGAGTDAGGQPLPGAHLPRQRGYRLSRGSAHPSGITPPQRCWGGVRATAARDRFGYQAMP